MAHNSSSILRVMLLTFPCPIKHQVRQCHSSGKIPVQFPFLVISHPFHGGLSQQVYPERFVGPNVHFWFCTQWIIQEDGNGGIALMSRYNRTYVAPKETQDATLVAKDVPFWFETCQERTAGYRSVITSYPFQARTKIISWYSSLFHFFRIEVSQSSSFQIQI